MGIVSLLLLPKRTEFPFVYIRLLFQVHGHTRLHVVEMMLNLKHRYGPRGPNCFGSESRTCYFVCYSTGLPSFLLRRPFVLLLHHCH